MPANCPTCNQLRAALYAAAATYTVPNGIEIKTALPTAVLEAIHQSRQTDTYLIALHDLRAHVHNCPICRTWSQND